MIRLTVADLRDSWVSWLAVALAYGLGSALVLYLLMLGGRRLKMVATLIYDEYLHELNWPLGAAIALILLVANLVLMLSYNRLLERSYKKSLG